MINEKERYALLRHIKWATRIAESAPYSVSLGLLDDLECDKAVHGDDIAIDVSTGRSCYADLEDVGRFFKVKRTEGVSTTDFITRLLAL